MNDLNSVNLIGRLGRDAELKYTSSGLALASFSICVNGSKKQGEGYVDAPNWIDVTYFGKGAEAVNQYLIKGKQVAVSGELRQEKWEKDGENRSKIGVVAHSVHLLGSSGAQEGQGERRPAQMPSGAAAWQGAPGGDDFTDDIPF